MKKWPFVFKMIMVVKKQFHCGSMVLANYPQFQHPFHAQHMLLHITVSTSCIQSGDSSSRYQNGYDAKTISRIILPLPTNGDIKSKIDNACCMTIFGISDIIALV